MILPKRQIILAPKLILYSLVVKKKNTNVKIYNGKFPLFLTISIYIGRFFSVTEHFVTLNSGLVPSHPPDEGDWILQEGVLSSRLLPPLLHSFYPIVKSDLRFKAISSVTSSMKPLGSTRAHEAPLHSELGPRGIFLTEAITFCYAGPSAR